jgi:DNA-binding MarR family transcriptional regulator
VQNAVDYADLGVATSGVTLFRFIGGSLGTATLGASFAARLAEQLARRLPTGAPSGAPLGGGLTPDAIAALPTAQRAAYAAAFTSSIDAVFLVAFAVGAAGFVLALLLPERPLRATVAATAAEVGTEVGETFPMPSNPDPLQPLLRGLASLADRDVRRAHIERIVTRAGVSLSAAAAWLLLRLEEDPSLDRIALGRGYGVEPERMQQAMAELHARGLVGGRDGTRPLTPEGCDVFKRLAAARRERLAELFSDWPPEKHEELAALLRRLVRDIVPTVPTPSAVNK